MKITKTSTCMAALAACVALGIGSVVVNAQQADQANDPHAHHTSGTNADQQAKTGWLPNDLDTCTEQEHEQFMVTGPDGRKYDGWHPPVLTRTNGEQCSFGHEHGDEPTKSNIYEWTIEKLNEMAEPGLTVDGIPFGYVSHQSETYAKATDGSLAHRHEDHYGHKFYVLNNVKLVNQDRAQGYVRDATGEPVRCDYLIKMHQGSHSADATRNNAHEMIYAVKCSDNTEAVISAFDLYGSSNEFTENCSEKIIKTTGSNLPVASKGRRLIPTSRCLENHKDVWAPYERWEGNTRIGGGDSALAEYSPFFGVRNPSRVWDSNLGKVMPTTFASNSNGTFSIPGYKVAPGTGQYDLDSAFDGAKRDVYVAGTVLTNEGGPTRWYTNPYGGTPSTERFEGAVPQYIASVNNSATHSQVAHQAFGFSKDYGRAEDKVHAPN